MSSRAVSFFTLAAALGSVRREQDHIEVTRAMYPAREGEFDVGRATGAGDKDEIACRGKEVRVCGKEQSHGGIESVGGEERDVRRWKQRSQTRARRRGQKGETACIGEAGKSACDTRRSPFEFGEFGATRARLLRNPRIENRKSGAAYRGAQLRNNQFAIVPGENFIPSALSQQAEREVCCLLFARSEEGFSAQRFKFTAKGFDQGRGVSLVGDETWRQVCRRIRKVRVAQRNTDF